MKFKSTLITLGVLLPLFFYGCTSDSSSPEEMNEPLVFETVNSDLGLMKEGGMQITDAAGVFSIGWNEMFRPFSDNDEVKGMAFAAAFGEEPTDLTHFNRYGLDMGNVYINYEGSQLLLQKRIHNARGVAYTLFARPFGNCEPESLLQFIPDTEYQFEVTGSELFAPITFSLTSPSSLMDITSHISGNVIDPLQDLTITWMGGDTDRKVAVRLMPHTRQHRRPHHPPFDRVITVILNNNIGTYTFASQEIQRILNGTDAEGLRVEVSQIDTGEVVHQNGILKTAMRNGSSVMLRVE